MPRQTPTKPPDAPAGCQPGVQARARATTERLLDAAERLLAARPWDGVAVADVAAAAGVSVGGFYARFENKAALLRALEDRILSRMLATLRRELAPERFAGRGVRHVIRTYVRTMVRFFARHRPLVRRISARVRADAPARDPAAARVQAFNDEAHGRLRALLLASGRRETIGHDDAERACALGVMMVSAASREMVLFGDRRLNLASSAGRELVEELTRAFCAYLDVREQE